MYLTGGQFKGTKIDVPKDVKPTLSKVRESIFNMLLQFELSDNSFLDMFSGSSVMGLEAISRGYDVVQLEIDSKNIQTIKSNYSKIKRNPVVIKTDSLKYKTNKKFSVIYIDPPWSIDYKPVLKKACELLDDTGVIFVEYDKTRNINIKDTISDFPLVVFKSKKYGRCLIDVLKMKSLV